MEDLNKLSEQTQFLLDKQHEVQGFCKSSFKKVYDVLTEKIEEAEKASNSEDLDSLKNIKEIVEDQEQEVVEQLNEDVEFLEEQLQAIKDVIETADEERAKELAKLILEDPKKVPDMKTFKDDVIEEAKEALESFKTLTDDLVHAIKEDDIQEVEKTLLAQIAEQEEDEDYEEDDEHAICESEDCPGGEDCCDTKLDCGCGEDDACCSKEIISLLDEMSDKDDKDDK